MIIGLIILAVVAVLIFFGVSKRFLEKINVPGWLAFLVVLALVVGAVLPNIRIGTMFSMNISGYVLPMLLAVLLMIMIGANSNLAKTFIAIIAVASVTVSTRILMLPTSAGMRIGASLIVGFIGGAVAYLIGRTRLATLSSALGGIVLGDIIVSLVYRFVTGTTGNAVLLGQNGIFDALIIASVFGVLLAEIVAAVRHRAGDRRLNSTVLSTESAEDNAFITTIPPTEEEEGFDDYFNDDID